jgi:hypothetical protein
MAKVSATNGDAQWVLLQRTLATKQGSASLTFLVIGLPKCNTIVCILFFRKMTESEREARYLNILPIKKHARRGLTQ